MDFIPKNNGKIKIKTTSEQNFVKITIEDNCIGISPDKIKNIFSKFYQIDTTITREHGGTGLGLTICKRIIESHGGKIWAESNGSGQGSKFHFLLPS
jgi:signal transduction histidine kinase